MRRVVILFIAFMIVLTPVSAVAFSAPEAPPAADKYMPDDTESFWHGFYTILKNAIVELKPGIAEALTLCATLIATVLITAILKSITNENGSVLNLASAVAIGLLLLKPSASLIQQGIDTVQQIDEYGKVLLPVMTAAMAAQGSVTTSAALYAGTAVFTTVLNTAVSNLIVPLIYVYLVLCISYCAVGHEILKKFAEFIKSLVTWIMKIVLYLFTGYVGITGVINGVTDAAALKATKLAISGLVPFVGNVLSDASETVLLSASLMKNAAGIYGMLTIVALCIEPFLSIGIQYIFLKATAGVCSVFGGKESKDLINDFSVGMGFLLAMTGIMSLLFMVSIVCFMKGTTNG